MAKKQWYTIKLTVKDPNDTYEEVIAKVKSKGLAIMIYEKIREVYKDTVYVVSLS